MALARRLLLLVAALTRRWCDVGFAARILAPLSVLLLRDASMRLAVSILVEDFHAPSSRSTRHSMLRTWTRYHSM
eukprot:4087309-Amphidinium_carterae.1